MLLCPSPLKTFLAYQTVKKPRSYSGPPLSKPFWPISEETEKLCPSPLKTFLAYQTVKKNKKLFCPPPLPIS